LAQLAGYGCFLLASLLRTLVEQLLPVFFVLIGNEFNGIFLIGEPNNDFLCLLSVQYIAAVSNCPPLTSAIL
jgi:hypothetical protein